MQPHRSFVLRCLPVRGGSKEEFAWRFSIQEAAPDAPRHAFTDIAELLAFLSAELERIGTEGDYDK